MSDLTDIGKLAGGSVLRSFLSVAHNNDGTLGAGNPNFLANEAGFLAWTLDPGIATTSTTPVSGELVGTVVYLSAGNMISEIAEYESATGSSVTHAWFALYDHDYNLVAETADSPGSFSGVGWVTLPLTTPYLVPTAGYYYVADLFIATTPPTMERAIATASPSLLDYPGGFRIGWLQTGLSGLPNPATPANSQAQHLALLT